MIPIPEDDIGLILMEEWSPQLIDDPPCCLRLFLGALQQCIDVNNSIPPFARATCSLTLSNSISFSCIGIILHISTYPYATFWPMAKGIMLLSIMRWAVDLTVRRQIHGSMATGQRKYHRNPNVAKRLTRTKWMCGQSLSSSSAVARYVTSSRSIYVWCIIQSRCRVSTSRNCSSWLSPCYRIIRIIDHQQMWYRRRLTLWCST